MGLGKGALRKMWSSAKDSVLKDRNLSPQGKALIAGFKDDLGPTLDDFESAAGKKDREKADKLRSAAVRVMNLYLPRVQTAKQNGHLSEEDADTLKGTLEKIAGEMKTVLTKL